MNDDAFWLSWLEAPLNRPPSYPQFFVQTYTKNPSNGLWLFLGSDAVARAGARARIASASSVTAAIDPNQINPYAYIWDIKGWEVLLLAHADVPDIQLDSTARVLKENAASSIRACRAGQIILFRE